MYTDEEIEDYIDDNGFGISGRLLESDTPMILDFDKIYSWESRLLFLKIIGVDYNNLKWYQKLELKLSYFINRLKNKT